MPLLFDYDNDGFLDVFLLQPRGAVHALAQRRRRPVSRRRPSARFPPRAQAEAVDFDGDGDLDLALVTARGGASLLENRGRQRERLDRRRARGPADGLGQGESPRLRLGDRSPKAQDLYVYRVASRAVTGWGSGAGGGRTSCG